MLLVSLVPIIFVLIGMIVLKKSAIVVSPLTLILTIFLAFIVFKMNSANIVNETIKGVTEGGKIIFLVWSAFAMLVMLQYTKAMERIKITLANITDDRRILLIMIGYCFSIFLEGAAGAGTPTAICAPFLVGVGFTPLSAAIAGMLGAGIAPSWGGAGATTIVGHSVVAEHIPLQLASAISGLIAMFGAFLIPSIMIFALLGKNGFKGLKKYILFISLITSFSFFLITNYIGPEIVSLGSGAIGIIASLIYVKVFKHETPDEYRYIPEKINHNENSIPTVVKAFAPYTILIIALPVIRFSFPLATLSKYGYVVWIACVIFMVVLLGALILNSLKYYPIFIKESLLKVIPAFISMGSLLSVANIMKQTGMLSIIAQSLSNFAGNGYPIVAVLIGSLGTFIAGTGLGSNIMFGPMHMSAAELLSLNKVTIFAAQNVGGAIGNMICPNNIVAVAATVDTLGKEGEIMKKCIPSWGILVGVYGLVGVIFTHIIFL